MKSRLDHVQQLADDLGVTLFVCLNCAQDGWGLATLGTDGEPVVFLGARPDASLDAYLVALHELGHHADEGWGKGLALDREAAAWSWALTEAAGQIDHRHWYDAMALVLPRLEEYRNDRRYKRTAKFESLYWYVQGKATMPRR